MIKFTKMNGLGNDFICMNYADVKNYDFSKIAEKVCNRHFGIGGDGLIILDSSNVADCKMRIFNSDGTEAEMCGNGIRCLAKYVYDKNIIRKDKLTIETLAGIKVVEYKMGNGEITGIKVKMGIPEMKTSKLQVNLPEGYNNEEKCELVFNIDNSKLKATFLSVGNPHAVIEVEDVDDYPVTERGKLVENHEYFPQKTNVEFVQIIDDSNMKVRIWERGVGETLACGTGTVASVFAMYKAGKVQNTVNVKLRGGLLKIIIDPETDEVYMEGPAEKNFEGEIDL